MPRSTPQNVDIIDQDIARPLHLYLKMREEVKYLGLFSQSISSNFLPNPPRSEPFIAGRGTNRAQSEYPVTVLEDILKSLRLDL